MEFKMKLTPEEVAIIGGSEGETKAKILKTLAMFGDAVGATDFLPIDCTGHLVTSFGLKLLTPIYKIMDEIIAAGLKVPQGFTVDPRPMDFDNVKCNILNKIIFKKVMYASQEPYEEQLTKIGLIKDGFTCTCYLPEVGNTPKFGEVIGWAESSAVVYANSVLGARCNRNSGMIDIFQSLVGRALNYGFTTDEGRRATWRVEIKTTKLPEAQILGSAIGMKVVEDVPYIIGLDRFLGNELNDDVKAYLKDMGAATASNGAVGLYHVDGLTPEAVEQGKTLIKENAKVYVIDDAELERVYNSYPVMWKDKNAKPSLCFIGCPHLTYSQLINWTKNIVDGLKSTGKTKVCVKTVMTSSPQVVAKFKKTDDYKKLIATGVSLASICPLMYTNNPIAGGKPIITNSNKLRTYSKARYLKDADILKTITGKEA
jgi:Uncharacterized conserved protein